MISRFAGHHGPPSFVERITQSWWRAHQTRIADKVLQLECLVVHISPAAFFIGVFSFGRVLLQVINPSFAEAQPCGMPIPSAHVALEAFSFTFAFGLSSTFAFFLWRRTCIPEDPTPQRQCAWLLSTYLKEGEEQKEVLEAKDDEEKESEMDGEVGESHSTCA